MFIGNSNKTRKTRLLYSFIKVNFRSHQINCKIFHINNSHARQWYNGLRVHITQRRRKKTFCIGSSAENIENFSTISWKFIIYLKRYKLQIQFALSGFLCENFYEKFSMFFFFQKYRKTYWNNCKNVIATFFSFFFLIFPSKINKIFEVTHRHIDFVGLVSPRLYRKFCEKWIMPKIYRCRWSSL